MTKTIVIASICCVASFLLGSVTLEKGTADEQQAAAAPPQRSFIGRYQMIMSDKGAIRILDTATGKYVQEEHIFVDTTEWVEIDPIGKKLSPERFAEKQRAELEARRRAIEIPDDR